MGPSELERDVTAGDATAADVHAARTAVASRRTFDLIFLFVEHTQEAGLLKRRKTEVPPSSF